MEPSFEPLFPFQKKLLAEAHSGKYDRHAWSVPRGNGKSFLAARLLADLIWHESPHFQPDGENVLLAASLQQARIVFRYLSKWLEGTGEYKWRDSTTGVGVQHRRFPRCGVRAISSNAKTAMGLVDVPWVVADEPGAWEVVGGQLMNDALETAMGKPGSPLKVLYVGTQAPANSGWWLDMIARGTTDTTHVWSLVGDRDKWDDWNEIKRCNPTLSRFPDSRRVLKSERAEGRKDTRLQARFLCFRLNLPASDEAEMVLSVEDWERTLGRPLLPKQGRPIVGVDLGAGRSWSAATAVWPNGRVEAFAVTPGIPSLESQEDRDIVPRGTYTRLADAGLLEVADGLRVQPVGDFASMLMARWPDVEAVICDRFRANELKDHLRCRVLDRVTRWSEAAEDIRALRKWAKNGPLCVDPTSKAALTASLMVALVKNDEQGNVRLVKRGTNNQARDDLVAALLLAVGERERRAGRGSLAAALEMIDEVRDAA